MFTREKEENRQKECLRKNEFANDIFLKKQRAVDFYFHYKINDALLTE